MVKALPPCFLELAVYIALPFPCHDLMEKTKKDDAELMAEALKIGVGPHGVNGCAVGTAIAFYKERSLEGLEIAKHKTVAPETAALATGATARSHPRVLSAEGEKLLYIQGTV